MPQLEHKGRLFCPAPAPKLMVHAPGLRVPAPEAEATRVRLAESEALRTDLQPLAIEGDIVFPVWDEVEVFEFRERAVRPAAYTDLLPEEMRNLAPRAFDTFGSIAITKIPEELWAQRGKFGEALRNFLDCRAVFHDHGVKGEFRVRGLEKIAGEGNSETTVNENGVVLHVDVGRAYYSPRLATERARIVEQIKPGEHLVDLFGGVAPLGVQAAKAGARVSTVDLNPVADAFAMRNARGNHVKLDTHCGDARDVAQNLEPADRIVMNLPHGAKDFLDVAKKLIKPGGVVHYHEILRDVHKQARALDVTTEFEGKLVLTRQVRNYAKDQSHWVFDIQVDS
jgi:tRNA (guanine37-N1)-methyltransferase